MQDGAVIGPELAHVGSIEMDRNVWVWSKLICHTTNGIYTIEALAVDPAGVKLACLGFSLSFEAYLFVLDATTGLQLNGYLKIQTPDYKLESSYGMLMQADGSIFAALEKVDSQA